MLRLENRLMTTIDTTSAVFKDTVMAYRTARQAGETDHPAFIAAVQAYEGHQPDNSEAGYAAGRVSTSSPTMASNNSWLSIMSRFLKA